MWWKNGIFVFKKFKMQQVKIAKNRQQDSKMFAFVLKKITVVLLIKILVIIIIQCLIWIEWFLKGVKFSHTTQLHISIFILDENSFVDTILETTEKILLHANVFGKTLLKNGEAKKMLILTSSVKLVKNKVLFYKSVYGHKIKKDYMETELEDTIQGLFTQVILFCFQILFESHMSTIYV